jgi:hypothetical protein
MITTSHAGADLSSLSLPDLFETNPTFLGILIISIERIYISQLPSENCYLYDVPQVIWCLSKHPEMHHSLVKDVIVPKATTNKQHPLRAETHDPIRPRPSTSCSLRWQKIAKGKETTNLVGSIAQMSEQGIEDLIEAPEKCWHQNGPSTRKWLTKVLTLETLAPVFLWHQHFSGISIPAAEAHWRIWERRVRNREGKWEAVGMGHKSVRQLCFIEDEMDAVDVYNRLRSHLLTIEYPPKPNPAFHSCDTVVSILTS